MEDSRRCWTGKAWRQRLRWKGTESRMRNGAHGWGVRKGRGRLDSSQHAPAATAEYRRRGSLQRFILKAGKPKTKERMGSVAGEGLLPVHRWCLLAVPSHSEEARELWLSGIPFIRTLTPSLRTPPSHLITSQWPYFQIPSRWGLGFQYRRSIQTIARGQQTFSAEGYFWSRGRIKDGAEKSGLGMVLTWCWARNLCQR